MFTTGRSSLGISGGVFGGDAVNELCRDGVILFREYDASLVSGRGVSLLRGHGLGMSRSGCVGLSRGDGVSLFREDSRLRNGTLNLVGRMESSERG